MKTVKALQKMDPDWWIELESTYVERIQQRKDLYAKYGKTIVDRKPGVEEASKELMEMVIEFLCCRYPNQFQYDDRGVFHNRILNTQADIQHVDPLLFLLENVPEDFIIMVEDNTTRIYHLLGGVSCSAVGWNMADKMGKPLQDIHIPVPDYKEKLQLSMNRFFSKMKCSEPIQRGSWSFEHGQPLFLQEGDQEWELRQVQSPDISIEDIHLRVDWQTLRRLPKSRTIVFNFKALFTPITSFREEPFIPRLVAKILRNTKENIRIYKNTWHLEHKMLPALDEWAEEQERRGWVPVEWQERTLNEHPYFPGWEKRWREEQRR
ncbi:hypothetical protein AX16_008643 [Volvariella volvacea WC 439]|nr:hypothetical protein AX16_008643 [Volvariella volvacea WC 439]